MTPVIDLADQRAVDGYEHPTTIKTRTRLRSPADAFPGSVTLTGTGKTSVDTDHPETYDHHGPPGQTSDANAQPLTRTHHRAKTHLPNQGWIIDTTTKRWRPPRPVAHRRPPRHPPTRDPRARPRLPRLRRLSQE